jgi:hypothetical protein
MKQFLVVLLLSIVTCAMSSAINWTYVTDWNNGLPDSVQVYHASQMWGTIYLNASYCIFDLSDTDINFNMLYDSGDAKILPEWIDEANAKGLEVLMISNGGYFNMVTDVLVSLQIIDGHVLSLNPASYTIPYKDDPHDKTYYPMIAAFGFYEDNTAEATWVYNVGTDKDPIIYSWPKPAPNCFNCTPLPKPDKTHPAGGSEWKVQNAIGSGPLLMKDGKIDVTWEAELSNAGISLTANPRTAICVTTDKKIVVAVVDGRENATAPGLQVWQLAELLKDLNCSDAINLDGGGSTAMIVNNQYLANHPSTNGTFELRPVPGVLMLTRKAAATMKQEEDLITDFYNTF